MAEYIDREAVCSDCKNQKVCVDKSVCPVGRAPAADVEVVKHGRWEHDSVGFDDFWRCTFCREDWFFDYDPTKESTRVNYCPNCGCKMDLEVTNGLDQH